MATDDLKDLMARLVERRSASGHRRESWTRVSKELFQKLEALVKEANQGKGTGISLTARFANEAAWRSVPVVSIAFDTGPLGLSSPKGQSEVPIMALGAELTFCMQMSGMATVIHGDWKLEGMPWMDAATRKSEVILLAEPVELNNIHLLRKLVADFIVKATATHWSTPEKK
ncbi:hypothetical protein MYSTI_02299 [Myxococcus stipitatus DSM 14675]|uniref:Uncharacterized protein n=1 Tax=Myxococcus stipitatus (strain DSM 14675 / JCM 12634 / Mx s8) TaxID=1278073 RepID=L7UAY1_MYXSD|nr:hypothetical protein [Myxococcus stipitatus]AGC43619.1 hypothetical protein MYSTI_02299 [Myxococcus stipitatus DSM 14675]